MQLSSAKRNLSFSFNWIHSYVLSCCLGLLCTNCWYVPSQRWLFGKLWSSINRRYYLLLLEGHRNATIHPQGTETLKNACFSIGCMNSSQCEVEKSSSAKYPVWARRWDPADKIHHTHCWPFTSLNWSWLLSSSLGVSRHLWDVWNALLPVRENHNLRTPGRRESSLPEQLSPGTKHWDSWREVAGLWP